MIRKSKSWELILDVLKKKWTIILSIAVISVIAVVLNSISPLVYKAIIDDYIPSSTMWQLVINIMMLITIPVAGLVINYYKNRIIYYLSNTISELLRKESFSKSLHMKLKNFETFGYHKLLQVITREIGRICDVFISGDLITMITNFLQLVVAFIVLVTLKWEIALICLVITPILYFVIKSQRKRVGNLDLELFALLNRGENYLIHALTGVKTIKAYNGQKYEKTIFQKWLDDNRKIGWKIKSAHTFTRTLLPSIIEQMMFGIVFITCAFYVMKSAMSIGTLVAVISYVPVVFASISALLSIQIGVSSIENAINSVDEILNTDEEYGKEKIHSSNQNVLLQFNNVEFSYEQNDFKVTIPNLTIHNGEIVAVVGETGGGKSSLFDIICNYYTLLKGTVYLLNQDVTKINLFELREYIALTSQDVFLWNHTIRENILYPNKLFNQDRYTKCLEYAQLSSFINELPEKDFTVLHDFGTQLSGGERQRISLARALYSSYQLLLLDEPTSALDSVTSKKIFDALITDTKETKKSMIYITHDISKSVLADKIAVINKGQLVEYDTPTNLINNSKYFKSLYNAVQN